MNRVPDRPNWFNGKNVIEDKFCDAFFSSHKLTFEDNTFFTPEGRMAGDLPLRTEIYEMLKGYAGNNVPRTISNIVQLLKLYKSDADLSPQQDRIHLAKGTLFVDGRYIAGKPEIVSSRLPVSYNPDAPRPELWLRFLHDLLHEEDAKNKIYMFS